MKNAPIATTLFFLLALLLCMPHPAAFAAAPTARGFSGFLGFRWGDSPAEVTAKLDKVWDIARGSSEVEIYENAAFVFDIRSETDLTALWAARKARRMPTNAIGKSAQIEDRGNGLREVECVRIFQPFLQIASGAVGGIDCISTVFQFDGDRLGSFDLNVYFRDDPQTPDDDQRSRIQLKMLHDLTRAMTQAYGKPAATHTGDTSREWRLGDTVIMLRTEQQPGGGIILSYNQQSFLPKKYVP